MTALSLIAFAYAGGITLISGAVFAGLLSAQALIPCALDKWFGLNGNWFLLVNPERVAGDIYGARTSGRCSARRRPPRRSPRGARRGRQAGISPPVRSY